MDTIGVIGAMEQEVQLLRSKMLNVQTYSRGGNTFYTGLYDESRIVLLQSGIGKVNATIGTTLLITEYDPMCVINTGSAGAIFRDLEIGDIVISSNVVHHDVDVTAFGYEFGQIPQLPNAFLPHDALVDMAVQAGSELEGINVHRAGIATGDSFMTDRKKMEELRERFPTAAAAEMEAAAIAQTCHQFNKPFVIIRSISDKADEGAAVSFDTFIEKAADNSANMVLRIIQKLSDYVDHQQNVRIRNYL